MNILMKVNIKGLKNAQNTKKDLSVFLFFYRVNPSVSSDSNPATKS